MADINFSLTPVGGDIDKYKVTLYDASGTTVITSKVYTPSFPSTITDTFVGLTLGATYKLRPTEYIGSLFKDCPMQTIVASSGTVTSTIFNFQYGETQADTTGMPLTEGEYLTSIQDTIDNGTVYSDYANLGTNVHIAEFNNGSDKVLWMKLPSTELAFTKWSEVGNPFQQNQPIDPNFATGSNVWFKSVQGSTTYYITRSQTDFAGEVVFSR